MSTPLRHHKGGPTAESRKGPSSSSSRGLRAKITEAYIASALEGALASYQAGDGLTSPATISIRSPDPFLLWETALGIQRIVRGGRERIQLGCLRDELKDAKVHHDQPQRGPPVSDANASSSSSHIFPVSLRSYSRRGFSGPATRSLASEVSLKTWSDASTNTPFSWRPTFHVRPKPSTGGLDLEAPKDPTASIDAHTQRSGTESPSRSQKHSSVAINRPKKKLASTPVWVRESDKFTNSPFRLVPFRVDSMLAAAKEPNSGSGSSQQLSLKPFRLRSGSLAQKMNKKRHL